MYNLTSDTGTYNLKITRSYKLIYRMQVIIGVLGFKWPLSKAISYPRLHHQLHPNTVVVDMDVEFPLNYQYGLLEKGHDIITTIHRAVVQGIHVDDAGIHATSDFRKGGIPDGYW